ncbi:MAG: hypothetical protein HY360_01870 [Verrucomicrobia bacterium]|nr:hypothetical protein [Verrucomicrobiota bacterium]
MRNKIHLDQIREETCAYFESLRDKRQPYGAYRDAPDSGAGFYGICDVALARRLMGEDLTRLDADDRQSWSEHIHKYQDPVNGMFHCSYHIRGHALGTAVQALCALEMPLKRWPAAFDLVREPSAAVAFLELADWQRIWGNSHNLFGVLVPCSHIAGPAWREAVWSWLDRELDSKTGLWRKGVQPCDPPHGWGVLEQLGGYVHIVPVYRHHKRHVLHLRALVQTILNLQRPDGAWFHLPGASYMDFDALYALWLATEMETDLRPGVEAAARKYAGLYLPKVSKQRLHANGAVHIVLCNITTLAILQRLLPDHIVASCGWGDIFDTADVYRLDRILPSAKRRGTKTAFS